ncbi:ribosome maturation factor RimP [Pengzhenrongella frigida]|uniref:Ribosome maturation factor RimP n=1 Tax=Pengzhenrongella frigida TaxID=1259133 RepID=A0A4Q5N2K7_9MICO|nr:ribosome maturation factor RimP [Cellulomonas sp. HLT2-17]RYV52418.1 ribosome maturation factor RimP [Cellulomonas sp. HLT2-17]
MAKPASIERVRTVVEPVVVAAGLVLEDLEVSPAGRRTVVRVTIDLGDDAVGGLDLDTVAEVARAVGDALDETSPVNGEYTLEVSTPGTSRPLTELRHFKRARTRLVRLTLRNGSAAFGRLTGVEGSDIALSPVDAATGRDVEGDPITIPLADIASASVEVELSRARTGEDDADGKS